MAGGLVAGGLVAVGLVALTACQSAPEPQAGAVRVSAHAITVLATPDVAPSSQVPVAALQAQYVVLPDGTALPNAAQTPGNTDPAGDRATVCAPGYTKNVPAPHAKDKLAVYAAYALTHDDKSAHRLDHLVPVSLGGTNAVTNLWPQPIAHGQADTKDQLELRLRQLVCAGTLPLPTAQNAIATDWVRAAAAYGSGPLPPPPAAASAPASPSAPATSSGPAASSPAVQ